MSDNTDSATFTVRLVNQVMAPARQIKAAMGDINKVFQTVQKTMAAPAPKRAPLSDWDKMMSKAKLSQAKDFGAQHARAVKAGQKQEAQGSGSFLGDLLGELAPAALSGGVAGAVAAGVLELTTVAKQAVVAVFDLGKAFVGASVEAAKFADHATLAIGYLTDNAPRAAAQFDNVRHLAGEMGLQVEETVGSFEKLLAAQFSVGQSKALIKMGADMQAIGASGEEVQRILYAMSEIKSIGTLQKRQERMLQMAGISGQLIDRALMRRMGLKDEKALNKSRKGNKIGADVATAAIMDAVMHKTHESHLGDVGKSFADTSLEGMQAQLGAGIQNFFMDVGEKIKPGLVEVASLVKSTLGVLMDDPELANFGQFMLNEFALFVDWAKANWPEIETTVVSTMHDLAAATRFVVESLDAGTVKGQLFYASLEALAVPFEALFGLCELAVKELEFVEAAFAKVSEKLSKNGGAAAMGAGVGMLNPIPGAGLISGLLPLVSGAFETPPNDNGIQGVTANGGTQALQTMQTKTEGSEPNAGSPVKIDNLNVTVPQAEDPKHQADLIEQGVHSAMAKLMRQAG